MGDEVFGLLRECFRNLRYFPFADADHNRILIGQVVPWGFARREFDESAAQAPDISFAAIGNLTDDFGSHEVGCTE